MLNKHSWADKYKWKTRNEEPFFKNWNHKETCCRGSNFMETLLNQREEVGDPVTFFFLPSSNLLPVPLGRI